ncbi:MAG: hypothetical protein KIC82_04705 [Acholeplasma sp.]|nr:hypothetical protein [Acholeplasma sp.]
MKIKNICGIFIIAMKDMVIDLVDLYILIRKSTENKEIENMVMLNNVYNKLTNGGGLFR